MHREDLLRLLDAHDTSFMEEAGFVQRARRWIMANPSIFDRKQPIHVTASAWVISPDRSRVFLVHHGKLHEWFQPGGHADGDNDVIRVAMKEASEEAGIDLEHVNLLSEEVFDVDIHWVPENEFHPAHGHIDMRFLVEIDDSLPVPGSHESHEVRWVGLMEASTYNNNRSTWRMVEKTRRLRSALLHGSPINTRTYWSVRRARGGA